MPENRRRIFQKLAKARQQLNATQARIAQLEAALATDLPPTTPGATVTEPAGIQGQAIAGQCVGEAPCMLGLEHQARVRQQVAATQQRYVQRLEIIHEIDRGLLQGRSIEAMIEATLYHLRKLIPCQRASVLLIDPTKEGWSIFAVDHTTPTVLGKGVRVPIPPHGFASFNAEKIQFIPDLRAWPEASAPDAQLVQEGLISALRVLLTAQENPIGMLSLSADCTDFFTDEYQEIAKQVASQLAIAIQQLLLSEAIARHNTELEQHLAELQKRKIALLLSEERYRRVVEDQTDVICRFDTDFKLTFVNQSYSALFGKTPSEMLGRNLLDGIVPEYHAQVIAHLTQLNAVNRFATAENPITLPNGSQHWFHWTNRNIVDEAGRTIEYQGVGHDITDQKNLQMAQQRHAQAVEEMGQFLQSALDAYAASTAVLASDGTIININATWKRLCLENDAPSPIYYLGENYLAVCDRAAARQSADGIAAAAGIRAVIEGHQPDFYMEYAFHSSLEQHWYGMRVTPFAEAAPRRVVVAHGNITERKQAEAAERAQRHFAEALLASLAALTSALDVESVLQKILDLVATVVPSEASSIILFEGNVGRAAYLRGFSSAATAFFRDYRFSIDIPVFRTARANKRPYFIADTQAAANWVTLPIVAWIRSSLGVPIEIRGEVIGLLIIDSPLPNHFQATDMEKLQAFARYASLALENADHATQLEARVIARTAELQTAKEQVEAILNNSLDGILLIHPDLRIEQANVAFTKLFICSYELCLGQSLLDFIQVDDIAHVTSVIQAALASQAGKHVEMRARRKDGSVFDAELSIGQIQADGLVCTIRDVTERKQSERQLRYYASLQANVSDAVISTNLHQRIQSWNRAAETIYGWSAADAIGQNFSTLLKTRYASEESYQGAWQKLFQQGRWQGEFRHYRKDGTAIQVLSSITVLNDEHGTPIGIVAINHDITERKQAEEAIRDSEARYRLLADNITDWVTRINAEGEYLYVSPSVQTLLGYAPEELLGQTGYFLLYPDGRDAMNLSKVPPVFTYRMRHKAGHFVWLEAQSRTIRSAETGAVLEIISSARDITERKRAEDDLREQRDFLQLVINNVPDLILVKDRAGRFQMVNKSAAQLHGITPAEMVGKTDANINRNQQEVAFFLQKDQETLDGGKLVFIPEEPLLGRYYQTSKVPLRNPAGAYDRLLVVASDITERKRTEDALEQSRHFAERIAETAPNIIYIYDIAEQKTIYMNRNIAAMMDYSAQEISAMGSRLINELMHPFHTAGYAQHVEQVIAGADDQTFVFEYRMKHKMGGWRWFLSRDTIFQRDEQGAVTQMLGVATDVTELKEAGEALQQALQVEKELGELKSRFVSMASHEFRTPLATILALTETLRAYRHRLTEEQIEQRLVKMQEQVDHLRDIMEDVLHLARLQARRAEFNPVQLDLDSLCRSVLDEFESQPVIRQRLVYSCDDALHEVKLDRKLMRQIISNLVSNAVKYSPNDTPIEITLAYQAAMLVLSVRDQGIGIPAADLKRLFEPFHRADNVGTIAGTGLGLTIAKESVELHAGTIAVESQVGIGTTFTVRIPLTTA